MSRSISIRAFGGAVVGAALAVAAPNASAAGQTLWVAAAAHAAGAGGSVWRTDLSVLNTCGEAVSIELRFHRAEGVASRTETVGAGQMRLFPDVVASLVSVDASGSIEVVAAGPVAVRSRTYNAGSSGTFGQSIDGIAAGEGLSAGKSATLQQLAENGAFRTNLGLLNMGNVAATATVTLLGADGVEVGSFGVTVPPGRLVQENAPYRNRFGRSDINAGYARIRVDAGSAVWAYGSVVDNATGDPTTITMSPMPTACGGDVEYTGSFSASAGEHDEALTLSGTRRNVFVYVPPALGPKPALLIAFHGTGDGSEVGMGRDMGSRFEPMADAHRFVIAAPEATVQGAEDWDQHSAGQQFWETMPTDDPARGSDPDRNPDLRLVRAIIAEATRVYDIDPKRIYVTGFSNGGFFSLTVAVALRERIAAGMEISAGLVRCDNTNLCVWAGDGTTCAALATEPNYCHCTGTEKPIAIPTSGRVPPMFLSHGNQDWTVSVCYSCELAARLNALGHVNVMEVRNRADHEIPDVADPSVYGPLWSFFSSNPLP